MAFAVARPRLPALTSLRFFAALHVVIFHLYTMQIFVGPAWYQRLASVGYVGVDLFFVLSGFILVYTYGGRDWTKGEFWRARIARVFPAYLFALVVTAPSFYFGCMVFKNLDVPFFAWFRTHQVLSWGLPAVLLQSWFPRTALAWNAPAWSLSDEAFFYAVFPWLVVWLASGSRRKLAAIAGALWMGSLTLSSTYAAVRPEGPVNDQSVNLFWLDAVKFHPLARLPEFVVGMCLGFLFLRSAIDRKWATRLVLGGTAMFVAVVVGSQHVPYVVLHDSLLTPAFAAIIYGLALRPEWVKVLEAKPLQMLGDASYSLYLLHLLIIEALFIPFPGAPAAGLVRTLGGIAVMVACSLAAFRYIEQPAREWLRTKQERQLPMAPEAARAW